MNSFYLTVSVIALLVAGVLGGITGLLPFITVFGVGVGSVTVISYIMFRITISKRMIEIAIKGEIK